MQSGGLWVGVEVEAVSTTVTQNGGLSADRGVRWWWGMQAVEAHNPPPTNTLTDLLWAGRVWAWVWLCGMMTGYEESVSCPIKRCTVNIDALS